MVSPLDCPEIRRVYLLALNNPADGVGIASCAGRDALIIRHQWSGRGSRCMMLPLVTVGCVHDGCNDRMCELHHANSASVMTRLRHASTKASRSMTLRTSRINKSRWSTSYFDLRPNIPRLELWLFGRCKNRVVGETTQCLTTNETQRNLSCRSETIFREINQSRATVSSSDKP